ncbi:carbohydrate ABC transporter permease [Facklamia sp. DSM 111018]|uniref:Carbohydrate ABC transporter permease n=1 Tax=Facklamia lactis TaxID=2749967 RepID=A0ABS0LPV3_9LACT|nr:carbohydrate ABC transporter permease [Facklamia lactis]MBG9980382.1 carbohydrate ABC transporter permease [Facklamia lactis]MBG9986185.1 carbohydrate ABC transporter permease [Facklamia lactis]
MKKINFTKILEILSALVFIILFGFPFIWMFFSSVKSSSEIVAVPPTLFPQQWQFENFIVAWRSGPFFKYTINSLIVALSIVALQLITVIPAAYAYARYDFFGKKFFWYLSLSTMMIPGTLTFLPIYLLFSSFGLINTLWSLILPFTSSIFGIFLLRQSIMRIPNEIIEAAQLDKAGEAKIIRRIVFPMIKPSILTISMLTFIGRWNDYFWPLMMTTKDDVRTLPIGVTALGMSDALPDWNLVMAANIILVFPILVIYVLAQKQIFQAFVPAN